MSNRGWQKPTCLGVIDMFRGESIVEAVSRVETEFLIREFGEEKAREILLRDLSRELTYEPVENEI